MCSLTVKTVLHKRENGATLFLWLNSTNDVVLGDVEQVIPAENLVAAFDDSKTSLYATANTASDAQVYLEALNKGTDGVVMNTDDPQQIYALRVINEFLSLYNVISLLVR
jgi:3-dehydroquinate synthase class II